MTSFTTTVVGLQLVMAEYWSPPAMDASGRHFSLAISPVVSTLAWSRRRKVLVAGETIGLLSGSDWQVWPDAMAGGI